MFNIFFLDQLFEFFISLFLSGRIFQIKSIPMIYCEYIHISLHAWFSNLLDTYSLVEFMLDTPSIFHALLIKECQITIGYFLMGNLLWVPSYSFIYLITKSVTPTLFNVRLIHHNLVSFYLLTKRKRGSWPNQWGPCRR